MTRLNFSISMKDDAPKPRTASWLMGLALAAIAFGATLAFLT